MRQPAARDRAGGNVPRKSEAEFFVEAPRVRIGVDDEAPSARRPGAPDQLEHDGLPDPLADLGRLDEDVPDLAGRPVPDREAAEPDRPPSRSATMTVASAIRSSVIVSSARHIAMKAAS